LKAGEQVIVEGLQKVQPEMTAKPVPFSSVGTNSIAPPASAQAN